MTKKIAEYKSFKILISVFGLLTQLLSWQETNDPRSDVAKVDESPSRFLRKKHFLENSGI